MIIKYYKFRAYPTKKQEILINKTFGCKRFVYNYFLDKSIKEYKKGNKDSYNAYKNSNILTQLKKEFSWLKEVDSHGLTTCLKDLERAYKKFFKNKKGYPKFKSKKEHRQTYRTDCNIKYLNNKIQIPKIGKIKIRDKQIPQGRILNATIERKSSGNYFISLCCTDIEVETLPKTNKQVGIDLGIKDFAILSDNITIKNQKFLRKTEKRIKFLQRSLSRKTRGSKRYEKNRIKLAKLWEKITNQKQDFLHKVSTELVRNYDIICIEDLAASNMVKNHKLAKCISEVSWYDFTEMLKYKCEWYGKVLIKVNRYYASSQLCNSCGYKNKEVKNLNIRTWECPNCGVINDRDLNASKNILKEGMKIYESLEERG